MWLEEIYAVHHLILCFLIQENDDPVLIPIKSAD